MVKKQGASKRFYEALEGIIWGSIFEYFSDRESMEYANPADRGDFFHGKMIYLETDKGSDWLFPILFWRSKEIWCPRSKKILFKSVILPKYPFISVFWHAL